MTGPTEQETAAVGKTVCCTHRATGKRACHATGGATWEAPAGVEAEGEKGAVAGAFIITPAGRNRPGKVSGFRITQSESWSRALGCTGCPQLSSTWPGVVRKGGELLRACERRCVGGGWAQD